MAELHPGEMVLQHYADGELSEAAAKQLRAHLEHCAECRAEVEALQEVWSDCAARRDDLLPGVFAPPPRPWTDLSSRMAEVDRVRGDHRGWFGPRRFPVRARAWAVAASVLLLAFALFLHFRETPSVQAAELLRKAVAAAKPSAQARPIQVRTKTRRFARPANHAGANAVESLQTRFAAAHYNWDDPLSARSFAAWREQLAEKQDQVTRERNFYRIRTNTQTGDLLTASLTLNVEDLLPVEARFDFRDRDWVQISEAPEQTMQPADSAPELARPKVEDGPRTGAGNSTSPALSVPSQPATVGDELRVFAALHRLAADLGDPVEVARSGSEIRVSGAGIPSRRQQELRQALSGMPYVALHFSEPAAPKAEPRDRVTADTQANTDISQLQSRLADRIGGREQFDQVAAQVLDLSETMMAHAYAVHRLAEHFPAASESELNAADVSVLNTLRREHASALGNAAARMSELLSPVLSQPGAPSNAGTGTVLRGASDSWQQATERLFQSARRVDRLSAVLFGNAPDDKAGIEAPAQLRSALTEVVRQAAAYKQIKDARSDK